MCVLRDEFPRNTVRFQAKADPFTFVLINIHTDPDDAEEEIYTLADVVEDARSRYPGEDDFILLGDLNADCDYFDEEDLGCPLRSMDYTWLIGNDQDTNLAASDCEMHSGSWELSGQEYLAQELSSKVFPLSIVYASECGPRLFRRVRGLFCASNNQVGQPFVAHPLT